MNDEKTFYMVLPNNAIEFDSISKAVYCPTIEDACMIRGEGETIVECTIVKLV